MPPEVDVMDAIESRQDMPTTPELAPPTVAVSANRQAGFNDFYELNISVSWFTRQKKVDGADATAMLAVVGASDESVGITRTLLASKHPAVKHCNAARRDLQHVIQRYTLPRMLLMEARIGNSRQREATVAPGCRLIRRDTLPQFMTDFEEAKVRLCQAVENLHTAMPDLREFERERQGRLFREADYDVDVRSLVSVELRVGQAPAEISVDLSSLCPELYRKEQALLEAERRLTVQAFVEDFTTRMAACVRTFASQLGAKEKIHPAGQPELNNAVIVRKITHGEDPTIPVGQITVIVQPDGKKAEERVTIGPLTPEDFNTGYRPVATDERNKVREDTVGGIKELLEQFWLKSEVFGTYHDTVAPHVTAVQDTLSRITLTGDAASTVNRLRTDPGLRESVANAVATLGQRLTDATVSVRAARRAIIELPEENE